MKRNQMNNFSLLGIITFIPGVCLLIVAMVFMFKFREDGDYVPMISTGCTAALLIFLSLIFMLKGDEDE